MFALHSFHEHHGHGLRLTQRKLLNAVVLGVLTLLLFGKVYSLPCNLQSLTANIIKKNLSTMCDA